MLIFCDMRFICISPCLFGEMLLPLLLLQQCLCSREWFSVDDHGELLFKHEEYQYLLMIKKILKKGEVRRNSKTSITKSIFGTTARYSLENNAFPLLTTKKMAKKAIIEELLWFLRGKTDERLLSEKNVFIWKENASRTFLDSRGLNKNRVGDLGPVYGFQWRHFGAAYTNCDANYAGKGVDQIKEIIEMIKNDKNSRRILLSAWNPVDLKKMALPPCHVLAQFYVSEGDKLSCCLYQRSGDICLGVPFNIASYSLLTIIIAHLTGTRPKELFHVIGDTHIYQNHYHAEDGTNTAQEQTRREPMPFPKLRIKTERKNIDEFQADDFEIVDYKHHPALKYDLIV
uniref:thymidylate synthase n=1 Tax=Metchnikovella dogieli TaxID=2804710 RepID=A0A890JB56_9MICR|nr:thymidylate synthase [Metchnikovella dogieli]